VFTTPELLELSGLTRRQLQRLEEAGAIVPFRRGTRGRGQRGLWSIMQAVGAAYAGAFVAAGCDWEWAPEACRWVSEQHPGELCVAFARGWTLLALTPDGQGRLVQPYLRPGATREQRLKVDKLNLARTYERVLKKAIELGLRLRAEEKAAAAQLAREEQAAVPKDVPTE
jgi:hypothetical protein